VLEVAGLVKRFPIRQRLFGGGGGFVQALNGVGFSIRPGQTLGVVGESGCGKTTLGKAVLRMFPVDAGRILWRGEDVTTAGTDELRGLRRHIQMVFQDPFSSFNPRMTCGRIVAEPLEIHGLAAGRDKEVRIAEMFERVGLLPELLKRYPHQLSGGQRQRLGIARALALEPAVLVADEPVSALDVSVQAQVLNLLRDLQRGSSLAYVFISHDLAVVEHVSHRIAVMYLGKIVEIADKRRLLATPLHPYTEALLAAVPKPQPGERRKRAILAGDVPSPVNLPSGCVFHTRCPIAKPICREAAPPLCEVAPGHHLACHLRATTAGHAEAVRAAPAPAALS
jgi:peptide/nickel transport system ATP-binding protein/oligopeptide transport system ATP-binding protein